MVHLEFTNGRPLIERVEVHADAVQLLGFVQRQREHQVLADPTASDLAGGQWKFRVPCFRLRKHVLAAR